MGQRPRWRFNTTGRSSPPGTDMATSRSSAISATASLTLASARGASCERARGGGAADAEEVALQPDGRIVAVGSALYLQGGGALLKKFALARYDVDGSLDSSFGSGGKVTTATNGIARDVAIQPDGKIVVAGSSESGCACHSSQSLAIRGTESLDPSFGSGGIVRTSGRLARRCLGCGAAAKRQDRRRRRCRNEAIRVCPCTIQRRTAPSTHASAAAARCRVGFGRGSSASPTAAAQQRNREDRRCRLGIQLPELGIRARTLPRQRQPRPDIRRWRRDHDLVPERRPECLASATRHGLGGRDPSGRKDHRRW